jgi:predicted HicB family RNase H-like nuclease
METKTINLRDLPEEFVRRAKAHAALSGITLKDFVIQAVEKAMQDKPTLKAGSNRGRRK